MNRRPDIQGGETLEAIGRRFVSAWKRAEAGEIVAEDHLSFETATAFERHMPAQGLSLLRAIEDHPAEDADRLAHRLGRDAESVSTDIKALSAIGLVDSTDEGWRRTRLALPKSA